MKNWKQILAPVLVFALGVVCGGGVTALYAIHKVRDVMQAGNGEERRIGAQFLTRQLRLDAEQRDQARVIFDEAARSMENIRIESLPKVRVIVDEAAARLRPILRPRQQRRLDRLLDRVHARWDRIEATAAKGEPTSAPGP